MGDRTVLAAAQERFAKLDHDPAALNGPLRTAWLGVIARHASKAEWGKLRQMANAAPSQLEKSSLFGLLGAAQDDRLAQTALDLALTKEPGRSEEHTSELQSLMRIPYAVFCLKKKKKLND